MKYKRVKKITININKHSIRQLTLRIKTMLFLVCSLFSTKPTTTKSREDNKVEHSTTGREKRRGSNGVKTSTERSAKRKGNKILDQ